MKKVLITVFIMLVATLMLANNVTIPSNYQKNDVRIDNSNSNGLNLSVEFSKIKSFDVKTKKGVFTEIQIEGTTHTQKIGSPKLPFFRKLIEVPVNAQVNVEVINKNASEYSLNDLGIKNLIIPTQPSLSKSQDPNKVPFEYDLAAYQVSGFDRSPIVSVKEIGFMRGIRVFAVDFVPVQYDPTNNDLRFYSKIDVKISFENGDLSATQDLRARTFSPYFEKIYSKNIINLNAFQIRTDLTRYPIKYVIISDPAFETQLQPFVEWKIQEGFNVIEKFVGDPEVGSTTSSIHDYLQSLWDASTEDDPAPTFGLIVGDVAQVPTYSGETNSHKTDSKYYCLEGGDWIPDMYFGRFSANNADELQPQIDKTLMYERYLMPDPSYLSKVVMIAGVDSGHAPTYGNGQINYGTNNYFNEAHGITSNTYLYPASQNAASDIIANASEVRAFINYTAHGDWNEWYSPLFTESDVHGLQNDGKYCIAIGNCCLTNKFEHEECFGESWLRDENGAVGYIGGTNSTLWDEDYWWGVGNGPIDGNGPSYDQTGLGVYDGIFHDQGDQPNDFSTWYTTTGSMVYRGNLSVTEAGSSNSHYYWEIYMLMGDPSLTPFIGIPEENTATYSSQIMIGMNTMNITAAPYSYVALTLDGEIHGQMLLDGTGTGTLEFTPFDTPGTAKLVIRRQKVQPLIADVEIIPANGPYVVLDSFTTSDNNDNIPNFDEENNISINSQNVGVEEAENVTAVLSSEDANVTITDDNEEIGNIAANQSIYTENAFAVQYANNVPDQYSIPFTITYTGQDTWTSTFNVTVNAPALEIGDFTINDATGNNNGQLDPGETADITIHLNNNGHATSPAINATLSSGSEDITIQNGNINIDPISPDGSSDLTFTLEVSADAQEGSIANLGLLVTAGGYSVQSSIQPSIGLIIENFETGDFSSFDWQFGTSPWEISETAPYEGSYCAQSSDINDNGSAEIHLTTTVPADGQISFYYKVSSENNYDFLHFYINGNEMDSWSGDVDWAQATYDVQAGENTFKWEYTKDGSVSSGDDCAWIDQIVFPAIAGNPVPIFGISVTELNFDTINVNETETQQFIISNMGGVDLTGNIETPEGFTARLDNKSAGRNSINYTVPANSNITVYIDFQPTEEQEYSGNIAITSNDPNNPNTNIAVNGTTGNTSNSNIPKFTSLKGNYPNPFNPETAIHFGLKSNEKVSLVIYNIKGQIIRTLINQNMKAGNHSIVWNGKNNSNRTVGSGVYFYKFTAGKYQKVQKMLLLK